MLEKIKANLLKERCKEKIWKALKKNQHGIQRKQDKNLNICFQKLCKTRNSMEVSLKYLKKNISTSLSMPSKNILLGQD